MGDTVVLTGEVRSRLRQWLHSLRNHTSDFFVWQHRSQRCYATMDGQIILAKQSRGEWTMVINMKDFRARYAAGHTRKDAFAYADNWAYHRMSYFLDHGRI